MLNKIKGTKQKKFKEKQRRKFLMLLASQFSLFTLGIKYLN